MSLSDDQTSIRRRNVGTEDRSSSSNDASLTSPLPSQLSLVTSDQSYLFSDPSNVAGESRGTISEYSEDVIIPKHLSYVSPKFNVNVAELISDEAFVLLRVEAFTLVLLFCVVAVMFAKGDEVVITVCVLGALISLCGVQGSLRKTRATLVIFWVGLLLWTIGAVLTVLYNLVITDTPHNAALSRCVNEDYLKMFGIDCTTDMQGCLDACRKHIKHHLIVSIAVFGSAVVLILLYFVYQARRLYYLCIFPEPPPSEADTVISPRSDDEYDQVNDTDGEDGNGS